MKKIAIFQPSRKKPLPVGMTEVMHEFLAGKGNKAQYVRDLIYKEMVKEGVV